MDAADVVELDSGDIASREVITSRLAPSRVSFALLRRSTVERYEYDQLLDSLGYHLVHRTGALGTQHGGYMVFSR